MNVRKLRLERIGQIQEATIEFGDLTVLVGPQATGKSILLQLLKFAVDTGAVLDALKRYGLDWGKELPSFLDIYLGEGMHSVWRQGKSAVFVNDKPLKLPELVSRQKRNKTESLFFIPAQRVLTLGRGWPRPFTDYSPGDPFVVRDFSEKLRTLMESDLGRGEEIFPQTRRLKAEIRSLLEQDVFAKFGVRVDKHGAQRRLVLRTGRSKSSLPFMVWSAGQREFVPLLLGFYWLLPPTATSRRGDLDWVVIEELEMGLHPRAISVVLLLVLDLLSRGYRVCLSTHSTHVLDLVWALGIFQQHQAKPDRLLELFGVDTTQSMRRMAGEVMRKQAKVYFFDRETGRTRDISTLDPGAGDAAEWGWGGLSEFSGRVADLVAQVINEASE
jgi:hypothetical protein